MYSPILWGQLVSGIPEIKLKASAKAGSNRACMLALEKNPLLQAKNIHGSGAAHLYGPDCTFHSNYQITRAGEYKITGRSRTCMNNTTAPAGGFGIVVCDKVEEVVDPFKDLERPKLPAITPTAQVCTRSGTECSCPPGRYTSDKFECGDSTVIKLRPGIYYLTKQFTIGKKVEGSGVTFYTPAGSSPFKFVIDSTAGHKLSAPTLLQYEANKSQYFNNPSVVGMLIWNESTATDNTISGNSEAEFIGNIYFPNAKLTISGSANITINDDNMNLCNTDGKRCTQYGSLVGKGFDITGSSKIAFNVNYENAHSGFKKVRLLK